MLVDVLVFAAAGAVVWLAGTRMARYAQLVSQRTGLEQALIGLFLLGGVTSLPEVATTITASLRDNAPLAVNNMLGGVAMQVVILALADAVIGRDAISGVIAHPNVLLIGTLNILLLALVAIGITVGDAGVLGVGAWSATVFLAYVIALWLMSRFKRSESWTPAQQAPPPQRPREQKGSDLSNSRLAFYTSAAALVILAAGYVLATRGEAIAEKSGLGMSFVGAVLVAGATSLPEIITAVEAVRLRMHGMAFADVFGTNLFDLALIPIADIFYAGPLVLNEVGRFSVVAALLALLLTVIYLAGLIERRDRVVLRMGIDSLAVILVYLGGLVLLFTLRA